MSDHITYAETAGFENIRFRLQNAETLAREATSTLTILLAGMGAAMAYAVKGFEQVSPSALAIGAAALSIWLMLVAVLLVVYCMLTTNLPAPTNEPMHLYQVEYPLESIRKVELRNLDERIKQIAARNHRVAAWIDRARLLAIASPIVFAFSALVWAAR